MKIYNIKLSNDWYNFLSSAQNYIDGFSDKVTAYPLLLMFFFQSTGFDCDFMFLPIVLNIFCSILNIYVIFLILKMLNINKRCLACVLCFLPFLPIQFAYSLEMIREAIPTFLISLSLLFFIKWFLNHKTTNIVISIVLSITATAFHAGCIAVTICYGFFFIFYDFKKNIIKFSFAKSLYYSPLVALFVIIVSNNPDLFLTKFSGVTDINALQNELAGWGNLEAGSKYLGWLDNQDFIVQLLCVPLKAIYFLFSPIIFDVRGLSDLFIVITDSSIFILTSVLFATSIKKVTDPKARMLIIMLFVILIVVACTYGLGVSNAGTAMRHRNKFISLPIILVGLTYTYRNTKSIRR